MIKTALITGGMGGIGEIVAKKLHDAGYRVIVTHSSRNTRKKMWQADCLKAGYDFICVEVDVEDIESTRKMANHIADLGYHVDIIINNAGITKDISFKKMTYDDWNIVIRTNLDSLYNVTSQFINKMIEKNWGRVINISSINGSKGQFGQTNYAASKAGVIGFTKSLALEVADKGITVNCISPGYQETAMVNAVDPLILQQIISTIPMKRLGQPREIADLVLYLCSDTSEFMTGANLHINGGQYMG
ncbi:MULTISPECIES: acetoacetyl-CoA reductase [Acinetobacter]|uniref:Acetoacetyl-CoA reductase n=1 Tax=Acinetobacter indicus TaxID=756892 RepID=A0A6C0Y6G7_9GAMM|nr:MULTISPECIES: acetoacetyl-CoA reductase [Acinetobacter]QIC71726.1 acetoacetyl-CoA reductase [Acinetobacter indicus]QKQ71634.1 acetoacetyl-CoA reductase [Acinetobacter sp. 10FS3-1]